MRIAAALVIAAALWAPKGLAEPAPARRIVLVIDADTGAERREAALSAIRAQLGDLPLEIVIDDPAPEGDDLRARLDRAARSAKGHAALGAFVLELDRKDDLIAYLVEPEARRALVRRITSSSEAAGIEELSLIVRSTSGALLEGREIGMEQGPELAPPEPPRPPTPEPAPQPVLDRAPPKPRDESAASAKLRAFYAGESYAPEAGWQSGLGLSLSVAPDVHWYAGASYTLMQAVDVQADAATARLTRHPIEAFAGYALGGERTRVGPELGGRVEVASRSTPRTAPGVEPTEDQTRVLFAAVGRVRGSFRLSERVALCAALGAQLYFNDSDYVVEVGGRHEPVLRPLSVRPAADAGVAVDLW